MDIFATCQEINDHILSNNDEELSIARNKTIQLLDYHSKNKIAYSPLVNHLIREIGLYPYLDIETASWDDRFIYEAFKVNIGGKGKTATLHREQSFLLKSLLNKQNIAVSAPTSFGKSFVVDAFIKINNPKNVVIIVPTIALTDETRRRIYKKFARDYKIITTSDAELGEKNIFIFPQERVASYINKIDSIDILIIDEFYKASSNFDKGGRSEVLLKAIIKLSSKAKQKYFLAPNIQTISDNIFTKGMEFINLSGFNTVFLEKYDLYKEINKDDLLKETCLIDILEKHKEKALIYAGTYSETKKVSDILIQTGSTKDRKLLREFAEWLAINYHPKWGLIDLIKKGTGVHNGKLHRSLSQIQVKLFEEPNGLDNIISTSSIIEGVNTSAENIILRKSKNGNSNINDFTYKNIIGRGGRMFKHFIGKIFLLDPPPKKEDTKLEIPFPDSILGDIDEVKYKDSLTRDQIVRILAFKEEMYQLISKDSFDRLLESNLLQTKDSNLIKTISSNIINNANGWRGLGFLNSTNPENRDNFIAKIFFLQPGLLSGRDYKQVIAFIKILSHNRDYTIPELLEKLKEININIEEFFLIERDISFKFAALVSDVNELYKEITNKRIDISPFISKISHSFLPPVVYQLEEYGLPRMLSKKLEQNGIFTFSDKELTIYSAIEQFHSIGKSKIISMPCFNAFDKYILDYFYEGITVG